MHRRRAMAPWRAGKPAVGDVQLCRGPGNLATALGIDLALNTRTLFKRPLTIEDCGLDVGPVTWGPRIGISKGVAHDWRCYVEGNPAVSAIKRKRRGASDSLLPFSVALGEATALCQHWIGRARGSVGGGAGRGPEHGVERHGHPHSPGAGPSGSRALQWFASHTSGTTRARAGTVRRGSQHVCMRLDGRDEGLVQVRQKDGSGQGQGRGGPWLPKVVPSFRMVTSLDAALPRRVARGCWRPPPLARRSVRRRGGPRRARCCRSARRRCSAHELRRVGDGLAVDDRDDVAGPDAGLVGRRAAAHLGDDHALGARRAQLLGQPRGQRRDLDVADATRGAPRRTCIRSSTTRRARLLGTAKPMPW